MLCRRAIDLAQVDIVRQNDADASSADGGAFAAQPPDGLKKTIALANYDAGLNEIFRVLKSQGDVVILDFSELRDFQFQKLKVGLALFFQVGNRRDVTVFQNQDLVAALFYIVQ